MKLHLNKTNIPKDIFPFLFLAVAGTLSHFLYEWTKSPLTALFCPVNESVWEHLKLLYFPFLFLTLIDYIRTPRRADAPSRLFVRLLAVLCGMMAILVSYYTYTGIIGQNFLIPDILLFLAGIAATLRLIPVLEKHCHRSPSPTAVYTSWLLLTLIFFLFTCCPPDLPLFHSP